MPTTEVPFRDRGTHLEKFRERIQSPGDPEHPSAEAAEVCGWKSQERNTEVSIYIYIYKYSLSSWENAQRDFFF